MTSPRRGRKTSKLKAAPASDASNKARAEPSTTPSTSGTPPLLALPSNGVFGHPAPFFTLQREDGTDFHFQAMAGRWIVLLLLGVRDNQASQAALDKMAAERPALDAVAIALHDGPSQVKPNLVELRDSGFAASHLFGALSGVNYRQTAVLIDRALRTVTHRPISELGAVLTQLKALLAEEAPRLAEQSAPVLNLPRVFEPELCEAIVAYYRQKGGSRSGVMRQQGGLTVGVHDTSFKRRKDALIDDEHLRAIIRARIGARLAPMVERAFAWRPEIMERYLIARYGDEDQGFFNAHRDNTTDGTAHRKFAVSINLNADYEGGELRFPEFGPRVYKPPVGGATVFSCSLLHEVMPVVQGERFVFVPFLYDKMGEKVLQENKSKIRSAAPG